MDIEVEVGEVWQATYDAGKVKEGDLLKIQLLREKSNCDLSVAVLDNELQPTGSSVAWRSSKLQAARSLIKIPERPCGGCEESSLMPSNDYLCCKCRKGKMST